MTKTERAMVHRQYSEMLSAVGYPSFGRIMVNRYKLCALLTMAVSQIAWLTNRVPHRVYQCLLVRLDSITRGAKMSQSAQTKDRGKGRQDTDDLHVICPWCRHDLLTAGPPTFDEIKAELQARRGQSPQKSPHSREDEGKSLHTIGKAEEETGKVAGAGCTGGGDPAGAGRPND